MSLYDRDNPQHEAYRARWYAILRDAERPAATVTPFPDPEGEDRDARRLIEWELYRG